MPTGEQMRGEVAALVGAARALAVAGLVPASSGNASVRSGDLIAITGGGIPLAEIDADGCVVLDAGGSVIEGAVRPSSEAPLHRAVYAATRAGAVVHTHSHFATVLSTLVTQLPIVHYAMASFGGPIRVAPYARFGSEKLATNVAEALDERQGALMANHGAVVIADRPGEAADLAVLLEWLCSVTYHALVAGEPNVLDAPELERVRLEARRVRYGERAGE